MFKSIAKKEKKPFRLQNQKNSEASELHQNKNLDMRFLVTVIKIVL